MPTSELYDSLFHATAVVGLNTSAMIEAAIVGRPVYTVATPEFSGGQEATFHWWYLLVDQGGVVSPADSFAAHARQLIAAPEQQDEVAARSKRFLEAFVRPRGLHAPASQVMVARSRSRLAGTEGATPRSRRGMSPPAGASTSCCGAASTLFRQRRGVSQRYGRRGRAAAGGELLPGHAARRRWCRSDRSYEATSATPATRVRCSDWRRGSAKLSTWCG